MSFGGFGNNTGGGFGGFGQNNNNANATSGSSLFGGNTATSGGFGGFGSNNTANNAFGAKPAFGAPATSTSGSLFGGGTSTTGGFGGSGFGSNNNAAGGATLSTGFGSGTNNNTTSLFGAKPATGFGATNTGGSLFGGGTNTGGFGTNNNTSTFGAAANTSTGFGASNTNTGAFGATNNTTGFGGFGGASSTPGTAATPFTPFTEKEATGNTTSAYHSITMQQPYQAKSFEELRLEDYGANKRYPQSNSFGSTGTFGGFGANNTATTNRPGLFGSTPANNTSFGAANNTAGFGANNANSSGGGLFGAKPATGGLFGNNTATATGTGGFGTGAATGGGLFGNSNNNANSASTFGGFGGNNTAATNNTAGGLFGANNTATKPAFGFGATNTTNTTNANPFGGFGNNANNATQQSGGLFGGAATNNAFGNNNNTGSSLFGNANAAKPATTGLFGGNTAGTNTTGGGLFGATNNNTNAFGAAPAGGLFGSTNTNNTNTGGGLFGAAATGAKPAGGLFGSQPAATGTGLFGQPNNTANNATGGSLFGNTANPGGGLFGNSAAKPATGLFGSTGNAGGSLFGGNNQTSGGGLFGNTNTAGNSLFGSQQGGNNSLFGNNGAPQQNQLTASITGDPYGNAQLFASLASPSPPVGPLATPLSGARPVPKARASLLASIRGGSPMLAASTSVTPRGRPGYGFSYSNYNTPLNGTPVLTPGASSLLRPTGSLGSALSSRLSKSFSTSNLRGELGEGQSLLRTPAPGQGSLLLGSASLGSGSVRRLKIDRSLRTDLFGDTPKRIEGPKEAEKEPELRKRVSFDKSAEKDATIPTATPSAANALVVRDEDEEASTPKAPEMSQINNGPPLTTVQEEAASDKTASPRRVPEAGDYYTEPPLKQLKSMSRGQLSQLKSFTVGRQGVGKIEFGRDGTVDLSSVSLDDICGKIVQLKARSATVYEDDSSKPPVGKGLNLPSTIYLEQSWPRASRQSSSAPLKTSDKDVERHKARLRRVGGTKFLDYNHETGIWSFTVEHFTTYELDDDEETTMQDTTQDNSRDVIPNSARSFDSEQSLESPDLGDQDDTFQFKLARRSQQSNLSLPGGFEDSMAIATFDDDASADEMQEDHFAQAGGLGDSAMIDPFYEEAEAEHSPSPGTPKMEVGEQDVPGSFHADENALKSILRPSVRHEDAFGEGNLVDTPWEDQLQRTLSPKKRDRQALRENQLANETQAGSDLLRKSLLTRSQLAGNQAKSSRDPQQSEAFTTSMDIMRSLWADEGTARTSSKLAVQSLQSPPSSSSKTALNNRAFKPSFTKDASLLFSGTSSATKQSADVNVPLKPGGQQNIKLLHADEVTTDDAATLLELQQHQRNTTIELDEMDDGEEEDVPDMPVAITSNDVSFQTIAKSVRVTSEASRQEKNIWELCSVLCDPLETCAASRIEEMDAATIDELHSLIRKDVFLDFWTELIAHDTRDQLQKATTAEEKAILQLCLGNVFAASETLMKAKNPRLALMVSQLPGSEPNRELLRQQIDAWLERRDWSEFSDGQRALYSILCGNTSTVSGTKKAAAEDRATGFCISQRYGLSWQQSLALKIRYGGQEDFQQGIGAYVADLADGVEETRPLPWHKSADDGEDTLFSLCRLVTDAISPESILDGKVVSGNGFQHRLAWQLTTLLAARGVLKPSDDQMDSLTMSFAAELESSGKWQDALWVLLHLNDNDSRYTAIKAVLERSSGSITDPKEAGDRGSFEQITQDLMIPTALVWHAKALHAKAELHDPVLQCTYLLRSGTADSYQEAHEVLCQQVGPQAVIEGYHDDLFELVQQFDSIGPAHFDGWSGGGLLYYQLAQLMQLPSSKSHGKEAESLLRKLDQGLEAQREAGEQGLSLEMRVARIEMRKIISERAKQCEDFDRWYSGVSVNVARHNKGIVMLEKYRQAFGEVH